LKISLCGCLHHLTNKKTEAQDGDRFLKFRSLVSGASKIGIQGSSVFLFQKLITVNQYKIEHVFFLFIYLIFAVLGFELRALCLLGRYLTT
jgi:hypothetical protein